MSEETKYTPGPWTVGKPRTVEGCNSVAIEFPIPGERAKGVLADVWDEGMEDGEAEANARLMAAAPDLLAALKRLRDDVQTAHVGADERCKDCAVCWSLNLADAAIAKAEGRDQ